MSSQFFVLVLSLALYAGLVFHNAMTQEDLSRHTACLRLLCPHNCKPNKFIYNFSNLWNSVIVLEKEVKGSVMIKMLRELDFISARSVISILTNDPRVLESHFGPHWLFIAGTMCKL